MRVRFSCPAFSLTYISGPDLLILHPLLIPKGNDTYSKENQLIFKGETKITLISCPLEIPVCPSWLEGLLRIINSFLDVYLIDIFIFKADAYKFQYVLLLPDHWKDFSFMVWCCSRYMNEKTHWSYPILPFLSGKEWKLPASDLCICGSTGSKEHYVLTLCPGSCDEMLKVGLCPTKWL